ncbi:hypothetical protein BV25DRAFT_1282663 [Artomyces pyxidatus]|uniref:Uncharacterized protein n=1 Tax=Artomyces pyxidatus TaxID=48021 RepID=A0ACB8SQ31_9AGAM|nr:hypothetical protein BV25DRAFT_1282663 [Artomyces pyxidatus]
MSEEASAIAREAKTLQQGLKELLKSRDPSDREVEFQRRNLQKQYLSLLLTHPYAKESKDAETHLWMLTSYALISIYKQRIANLERALREPGPPKQQARAQRHGPVEYRKLLQRFKQFLANEERFWIQLVVRFQRQFLLSEAKPALAALGILASPEHTQGEPATSETDGGNADVDRQSHFQFPTESHSSDTPPTQAQHAGQLSTLSKALVCLGDLARYREQYNESGGRARADEGGRRGGRNRRQPLPEVAKAKTYDKARACYERARDLVPNEGNASHQLAILASYQKDTFESLVHYYKALCVRIAYDPAGENMASVLTKFLDVRRRKKGKGKGATDAARGNGAQAQSRTTLFKENVVLLHSMWRLTADEMDSLAPQHDAYILKEFRALVSERFLSIDAITKVLILAQGALWTHRMVRAPTAPSKRASIPAEPPVYSPDSIMESRIAGHLLALHRVLLEIGLAEMDEVGKVVEEDLAMRITATFRRTLPALRMAGKWVRANIDYVDRCAPQSQTSGISRSNIDRTAFVPGVPGFWEAYRSFGVRLASSFPPNRLPKLRQSLEEDIEVSGYLPLASEESTHLVSGVAAKTSEKSASLDVPLEQVHPNVEQLMRIWDIWHDAQLLAETKRTPMELFVPESQRTESLPLAVSGAVGGAPIIEAVPNPWPESSRWASSNRVTAIEEDARTEITKTDDDPVGDAFRQVLSVSSEEEEQDEIVWDPSVLQSYLTSEGTPCRV